MTHQTPDAVLSSLRGQSFRLPDLNVIFRDYPLEVNLNLERLRTDVNAWLDNSKFRISKIESLKAADIGYFGASWWPRAPYDRLRIMAFVSLWIFAWDDELDEDQAPLWDVPDLAEAYRVNTRDFVRYCLGLNSDSLPVKPSSPVIHSFESIAGPVKACFDEEQCARLAYHIEDYIEGCKVEEQYRRAGVIPSVEEYWKLRLRNSAICVELALNEYACNDIRLSKSLMESANMKELWLRVNILISIVNDILSLKKEIAQGNTANMVSVQYAQLGDVQSAVDETTEILVKNTTLCDDISQKVLSMARSPEETSQLREYVLSCRFLVSGNLSWALLTQRYGIFGEDLSSGVQILL